MTKGFSRLFSNLSVFLFISGLASLLGAAWVGPVLGQTPGAFPSRAITQAVVPTPGNQNGQPAPIETQGAVPADSPEPAPPVPAALPPAPPSPLPSPAAQPPDSLTPAQPTAPSLPPEPGRPPLTSPPGSVPGGPPGTRMQTQPPPAQPGQPSTLRKPTAKRGEVSFNFDDADVFSVIQTIYGGVLKVNYIIDPKVKGRVNFRSVSPVPKEDVMPLMEVILRLNGIGVIEDGGLYRIIPIGDMPREPAAVGIGRDAGKITVAGLGLLQVVPLKFIPSSEMIRVLTPFLSTNAVMVDVPKINYIIIVDTDANVKRLLQLVEIFDSEQLKQIKPQVFVYPVRNGKAKDVAALLQQIFLGGSKAPTPSKPSTPPARPTVPGQPAPAPTPSPQISLGPTGSRRGAGPGYHPDHTR